jgi:glyoxylase-like metal-dependent hydrolase (beta-lactamase superfamily II)
VWGAPQAVQEITSLEEVADVLRTPRFVLRAVETPGHSRDHVAYFEPTLRWLFSGDAYIGGRDRTWAREFDLFGVVGSLQSLATLAPERLFPGSGNVRRNPLNDINEKIRYLQGLARDVAKLDAAGVDAQTMADRLLEPDSSMTFWTQGHFSALNLIEACRSYNALVRPAPHPHRRTPGGAINPDTSSTTPDRSTDFGDLMR